MMNFNGIVDSMKMTASRIGFSLKTHSPEILAVTGVVGIITGTVLACKATTKASDILEKHNKEIAAIEELRNNPELCEKNNYDPNTDGLKNLIRTYLETAGRFLKLYGPSIVLIGGGIGCLLGSNNILKNRWLGAAGAYEALNASVNEYRKRVGVDVGEEREKELWNNIKTIDVTEQNEDGMDEVKKLTVADPGSLGSPYAVIFDELNHCWKRDASYNRIFLQCQEAEANRLLCARGYLWLSEVLELLGYYYEPENERFDISPELAELSRNVGWTMVGKKEPNVQFSVLHANTERAIDFRKGFESSCVIDFNIDGDIRATMYRYPKKPATAKRNLIA